MLSDVLETITLPTEADLEQCRKQGRYLEPLFDLYRAIGMAGFKTAEMVAQKEILPSPTRFALAGLVNRVVRLMLANVHLTHQDEFGDAAAIIDRSIMESCVNIMWICQSDTEERLQRYLADGLKADRYLLDLIRGYIKQNGGEIKRIEERMLRSVNGCMARAGLSEEEVESTKGLPRLNQRLEQLGLPPDFYIAFQRMGSHAVHGTWTNLMQFYLRDPKGGPMTLKDEPTPPREDQYAAHAMLVLQAAGALAQFAFEEDEWKDAEATYKRLHAEVMRVYDKLLGPDSEVVSRET